MKKEHPDNLVNYLKSKTIVTISELATLLNISARTVQRRFKLWEIIRSYDHNSSYFALQEVAGFDDFGIWEHKAVHFSIYGNLKNTLIGIINNSEHGMNAIEIRSVLGLDTRSFLFHYKDCQEIKREKVGSYYVYFSANSAQYAIQNANRKKMATCRISPVLKDSSGIIVLVETIKHPGLSAEGLSKHLRRQDLRVKPKAIMAFYKFHGIEKKTGSGL